MNRYANDALDKAILSVQASAALLFSLLPDENQAQSEIPPLLWLEEYRQKAGSFIDFSRNHTIERTTDKMNEALNTVKNQKVPAPPPSPPSELKTSPALQSHQVDAGFANVSSTGKAYLATSGTSLSTSFSNANEKKSSSSNITNGIENDSSLLSRSDQSQQASVKPFDTVARPPSMIPSSDVNIPFGQYDSGIEPLELRSAATTAAVINSAISGAEIGIKFAQEFNAFPPNYRWTNWTLNAAGTAIGWVDPAFTASSAVDGANGPTEVALNFGKEVAVNAFVSPIAASFGRYVGVATTGAVGYYFPATISFLIGAAAGAGAATVVGVSAVVLPYILYEISSSVIGKTSQSLHSLEEEIYKLYGLNK